MYDLETKEADVHQQRRTHAMPAAYGSNDTAVASTWTPSVIVLEYLECMLDCFDCTTPSNRTCGVAILYIPFLKQTAHSRTRSQPNTTIMQWCIYNNTIIQVLAVPAGSTWKTLFHPAVILRSKSAGCWWGCSGRKADTIVVISLFLWMFIELSLFCFTIACVSPFRLTALHRVLKGSKGLPKSVE